MVHEYPAWMVKIRLNEHGDEPTENHTFPGKHNCPSCNQINKGCNGKITCKHCGIKFTPVPLSK